MKVRSRLFAVLAGAALLLAACGDETAPPTDALELERAGVLRVGSDIDFPPFESYENGEPVGFDVDLMEEIAGRLGLEVEWVDVSFDVIFTQLAGGEFDAIISAITITTERERLISFTAPYFAADQSLVVQVGSEITGVEDLEGARVGAQEGTTGQEYAEENFTGAEVVAFPTYPAAFTQLEAGQIDAVLADRPAAAEAEARSDAIEIIEEVETGELYGIGVQQDAPNLRVAIDEALREIIDDGTYADVYARWFEGDPPEPFLTG
jgi:ABC-type amino acid transport substrate-binding protein